jgi:hypothetical protein
LAETTRIFKANGLDPVPMKPCAPSLKVESVEVLAGVEPSVPVAPAALAA